MFGIINATYNGKTTNKKEKENDENTIRRLRSKGTVFAMAKTRPELHTVRVR